MGSCCLHMHWIRKVDAKTTLCLFYRSFFYLSHYAIVNHEKVDCDTLLLHRALKQSAISAKINTTCGSQHFRHPLPEFEPGSPRPPSKWLTDRSTMGPAPLPTVWLLIISFSILDTKQIIGLNRWCNKTGNLSCFNEQKGLASLKN